MPVKFFVDKVVQNPIAHCCFVDVARLWIRNVKCRVWTVCICFILEVGIEARDIGSKLGLKFYNVFFAAFAAQKLLPRQE